MTVVSKAIIVVGASGHGKVVADVAVSAGYKVLGFVDDAPLQSPLRGVPVLGCLTDLSKLAFHRPFDVIMGIGDNRIRRKITAGLGLSQFDFASVVAPSAVVSQYATIGRGTVVMPGVVVNAGAVVGDHVILNSGCIVEHDCTVEDHAHLSPGVCLSGNVRVGCGAHLGTGVSVLPGIDIGSWSMVGAGAVVTVDVGTDVTAVGVPARTIRRNGREAYDK